MAVVTSGGSTTGNLADTVEAAIDAEDLVPLVRVVFDAVTQSLNSYTTKQALLTRSTNASSTLDSVPEDDEEASVPAGRRASDRVKASRKEVAAPVINLLEKIVDERSTELAQICRGNAEEIVSSLQELEAMQEGTEELRERVLGGDGVLRKAGTTFVNGLEQLQDLQRVERQVEASCRAVGAVRQLMQLCAQAGRAVTGNELYKAFCLLKRSQNEFLNEPADSSQMDARLALNQEAPGRRLSREVRLHSFLMARVEEMQAAMQQTAITDFNTWLVTARSEAQSVGWLALRRAAWERQREASQLETRRRLAAELSRVTDPDLQSGMLAKPLPTRFAGTAKLNVIQQPSAAALMEEGPVDPFQDFMVKVDMTQLHRCVHLHQCLGKLPAFQAYYQTNRRMQLNNDLSAHYNFINNYRNYLSQLVGFFVIEERVGRVSQALSGGELGSGWETAIAYLKLGTEAAFATINEAGMVMKIKDFILLACSALENLGYHVAPLHDMLLTAPPKYHQLLAEERFELVRSTVEEFSHRNCRVPSAVEAAELSGVLGLPLVMSIHTHGGGGTLGPTPPFDAPFSEMVPRMLHIARGYVEECAAYKWGLFNSAMEIIQKVRLRRDTYFAEQILHIIEGSTVAVPADEPQALHRALQTIADLDALSLSLQALDDFTCLAIRGTNSKDRPEHRSAKSVCEAIHTDSMGMAASTDSSFSTPSAKVLATQTRSCSAGLTAKFVELLKVSEGKISEILTLQLRDLIKRSQPHIWCPEEPAHNAGAPSQLFQGILTLVKEAQHEVSHVINIKIHHHIVAMIMKVVGDVLMGTLLGEETPAYNLYGLFRFNTDLMYLQTYANESPIPHMEQGLSEALQFCDLMVTGRLEEILDEKKRAADYPAINLQNLAILLRKFKEVGGKSGQGHTYNILLKARQPESFLKKKTAERVLKQLKAQVEQPGAAQPYKKGHDV